jgi:hypothetical protein
MLSQEWKLPSILCSSRDCTLNCTSTIHECCKLAFCDEHKADHDQHVSYDGCTYLHTNAVELVHELQQMITPNYESSLGNEEPGYIYNYNSDVEEEML